MPKYTYQQQIATLTDADPRYVEAFMRLQYGVLDHLDPVTFRREVRVAESCIAESTPESLEALAASWGI